MNQKIPHKNMSHKRVRHKKITDRHNGKEQIYYEIRKVLSGTRSRLAFLLLAMILGITLYFAISVEYVNETGESEGDRRQWPAFGQRRKRGAVIWRRRRSAR